MIFERVGNVAYLNFQLVKIELYGMTELAKDKIAVYYNTYS